MSLQPIGDKAISAQSGGQAVVESSSVALPGTGAPSLPAPSCPSPGTDKATTAGPSEQAMMPSSSASQPLPSAGPVLEGEAGSGQVAEAKYCGKRSAGEAGLQV